MRKVLSIILCSLLLTLLFVWGKYTVYSVAMPRANYGMRAISAQPRISQLFIGSSMFRKGIYAPDFDPQAYLLAYNGNQPAYEYLELENMLSHGAQIERVVVDMYPYSAIRPSSLSDLRLIQDGDLAFALDVYHHLGSDEQSGPEALFKMVVQANNETLVTWPISFPLTNSRYTQGANNSEVPSQTADFLDNTVAPEMQVTETALHPDQLAALDSIICLCQSNSIELVFLETPKYYKVYEDPVFRAIMSQYITFLANRQQSLILCNATCQMLGAEMPTTTRIQTYTFDCQDPANYSDRIHLSSAGRIALSQQVKAILDNPE